MLRNTTQLSVNPFNLYETYIHKDALTKYMEELAVWSKNSEVNIEGEEALEVLEMMKEVQGVVGEESAAITAVDSQVDASDENAMIPQSDDTDTNSVDAPANGETKSSTKKVIIPKPVDRRSRYDTDGSAYKSHGAVIRPFPETASELMVTTTNKLRAKREKTDNSVLQEDTTKADTAVKEDMAQAPNKPTSTLTKAEILKQRAEQKTLGRENITDKSHDDRKHCSHFKVLVSSKKLGNAASKRTAAEGVQDQPAIMGGVSPNLVCSSLFSKFYGIPAHVE